MRKGFTLIEALVTLGIIGTIAAITIPSIVNGVFERETIAKARKLHNVLNQGIHNAISTNDKIFKLYCQNNSNRTHDNFVHDFEIAQSFNVANLSMKESPDSATTVTKLKSGETFYVAIIAPNGNSCGTITADTNGTDNPNQIGVDRFIFDLSCDGHVTPQAGTSEDVIIKGDTSHL